MQTVFAQDNTFTFDDIRNGRYTTNDPYLHDTLEFCSQWLNGFSAFSFTTSGSTGAPKAIIASREHMLASAKGTISALGLTSSESVYLCISSKMIGGAMMLVRALELGCDLTIVQPSSNPLEQVNENHSYTFASFVPMQVFEAYTDSTLLNKLNRFNNILLGGAPANEQTLDALGRLEHCMVWQTYGMTETLSHIALRRVGHDQYYETLPGVKIKQDDRNCLCINAEVTDNQWLLTNDVVSMIDEHHFELMGRIDDVINSGGIKIFSYDVERAITQKLIDLDLTPKPMFVCRKKDEKYGETVVVVMMGEPLSESVLNQLTDYCKKTLGKYAAPKHIFFVNEFEKLESGKLDKKSTLQKILNCG